MTPLYDFLPSFFMTLGTKRKLDCVLEICTIHTVYRAVKKESVICYPVVLQLAAEGLDSSL